MYAPLKQKMPFEYNNMDEFPVKLANWIGHVFYDILPEHGYEIREEQVFTAFQIADSVCRRKVHFAEAGLGTGKTFAYLLTAISYARYTGKPVVIACASTALQEQLAGEKGDINTLSNILGLDVDVRMAKDPRQYICDVRTKRIIDSLSGQPSKMIREVIHWAEGTNRGERSEVPHISDRVWAQVAWNETMPCETCSSRGFCKLVKARAYYRPAKDLIIGDHGIFFDDLWTRDERIAEGKLPFLPVYSAVILDEGHKVMLPAAMRAGTQIVKKDIDSMLSSLEQIQGSRTSLISAVVAMEGATLRFFKILHRSVIQDDRTERLSVQKGDALLQAADILRGALDTLQFELQSEQELHIQSVSITQLQAYEARIDRAAVALDRFLQDRADEIIFWVDQTDGSFWVVPRNLSGLLKKHLFEKKLPVLFSSATLSTGGDFSYLARTLGLINPSNSSVGSSFELGKQVLVYLPRRLPSCEQESWFSLAVKRLNSLLRISGGRALVLTNALSDVRRIRTELKDYRLPYEMLWEDSAERGYLLRRFRESVSSVLVGSGFWEGIDVPGEALSLLVIWRLPFPSRDPLIDARRNEAKEQGLNPLTAVEYPEMGLRLKQGCGRLIRKREDRGVIAILEPVLEMPWENFVMEALPIGAEVVGRLESLSILRPRMSISKNI